MSGISPIQTSAAQNQTLQLPQSMQFGAQQGAYNTVNNLSPYNTTNIPGYTGLVSNIQSNPFASNYLAASDTAGRMGEQNALQTQTTGQNLLNLYPQLQQAGTNVLNNAFDPQLALYNKYLQTTQQQAQAMNAQSGVASTPYAAGLNAQTMQNFNIGWNAQQLQNQIQGLNAAGQAYTTGANIAGVGTQMEQQAPIQYMQSAQLPYSTYNQIQTTPMQALQQLQSYGVGGSQIPQQQFTDWSSLLGLQTQLQGSNLAAVNQQAALQQQMVSQLGGGIGTLLGLGMMGGGGFGGGMGGLFSGGAGNFLGPQNDPNSLGGMGGWEYM